MLKEQMPYEELLQWSEFFRSRPIGWRDDQRTYMLLKAQGVKGDAENLFPTLRALKSYEIDRQKPDRAVPKGRILELMLKAKGGDKVSLFNDKT